MTTYWGKNKTQYILDQKIGSGGEGEVYSIVGMSQQVAKIYHPRRFHTPADQKEMLDKLSTMIDMSINPYREGHLIIAWPIDILFNDGGSFVGFVMPKVENRAPILCSFLPTEREKLFPNYTWGFSPKIAYNLATTVAYLHNCVGITIGDLNTENFMIDNEGYITAIDADSFTIVKDGHSFKCRAGVPEMLAPELQGKDLTLDTTKFTQESDVFSLAVLIFQILVNGVHPFAMPNLSLGGVSTGRNAVVSNIVTGYCPYTTKSTGKRNIEAFDMCMLPAYIRDMFDQVFCYDAQTAILPQTISKRPSAEAWANALYKLAHIELSHCRQNYKHVYPKEYNKPCPWCEIQNRTLYNTPAQNSSFAQKNISKGGTNNSTLSQTPNHSPQISRPVWPIYTVFPLVGGIGTMIFAADMASFSDGMNISMSNNVACWILAIVGIIMGLVIASMSAEHYKTSSHPSAWILLAGVTPIAALIVSMILIIGLYIAIVILVLGMICYIFSDL